MKIKLGLFIFLFCVANLFAQEISGVIIDNNSKQPIEGASVYFDNTTIGVISNSDGAFTIPFDESINTPLVISFLGYKKQVISNYNKDVALKIELKENLNTLNEVVIGSKDSWSREKKLEQFKLQFLGFSSNSLSCKILNEDDITLRYLEDDNLLVANAKRPIRIRNSNLGYDIEYDLQDFEIQYEISSGSLKINTVSSVFYSGTTFYKSNKANRKTIKRRQKAYYGSMLHFMRSLLYDKLEDNKFTLLYEEKVVPAENFISKYVTNDPTIYKVKVFKPLTIVYDLTVSRQSTIIPNNEYFYLNLKGNYSPIEAVTFTGEIGMQRVGDNLPLDYDPMEQI
ncbi:carboxypeptidase-like regulatory domain-containing protein [Hanstruepera flava]|uniref:carboxypeptidase-like regulatory domain-containing protein n=1 Tax=Hanstruepera flava TaxID=2930218 RepID=UPI002027C352|nr:carboxypeptidase-like regulatory domain-containing protein [Hanstruepera flava]